MAYGRAETASGPLWARPTASHLVGSLAEWRRNPPDGPGPARAPRARRPRGALARRRRGQGGRPASSCDRRGPLPLRRSLVAPGARLAERTGERALPLSRARGGPPRCSGAGHRTASIDQGAGGRGGPRCPRGGAGSIRWRRRPSVDGTQPCRNLRRPAPKRRDAHRARRPRAAGRRRWAPVHPLSRADSGLLRRGRHGRSGDDGADRRSRSRGRRARTHHRLAAHRAFTRGGGLRPGAARAGAATVVLGLTGRRRRR